MPEKQEITEPKRLDDPDMRGAEKAIHRAALKARERARRFGHGIIIYENGKMTKTAASHNESINRLLRSSMACCFKSYSTFSYTESRGV